MKFKLSVIIAICALALACGGNPTAPTPMVRLAFRMQQSDFNCLFAEAVTVRVDGKAVGTLKKPARYDDRVRIEMQVTEGRHFYRAAVVGSTYGWENSIDVFLPFGKTVHLKGCR